MRNLKDSYVIDRFVAYLRKNGYPNIKVDRRPDKENRDSSDIDAIAGPFAIEHTSIDTLPDQRLNNNRFMQVIGNLEQEFSGQLPFHLYITLKYDAITTNQDWKAIHQALKVWIIEHAPHLEEGHHVLDNVPGVPFKLHVDKKIDFPPGLFFARFPLEDSTLADRIKEQGNRKAKKLAKYQNLGKTTVLLIESYDFALMNPNIMLQGICNAYPNGLPSGVDKIWYVDTSIPDYIRFTDFTSDLLTSSSI